MNQAGFKQLLRAFEKLFDVPRKPLSFRERLAAALRGDVVAEDARWITVKPNGPEHKGQPACNAPLKSSHLL